MSNQALNNVILMAAVSIVGAGVIGYCLGIMKRKGGYSAQMAGKKSRIRNVLTAEDVKVQDKKALVDVRIEQIRPLVPPACLLEELPLTTDIARTVNFGRQCVSSILKGEDDRLVCIVGPCSIHDVEAAKEYAQRLKDLSDEIKDDLFLVMRVYFEKPRTTVGWKGLINDPKLDGTFDINMGLRIARKLLCDINELGLPAGCEFLDTISPQFTADLVSWGAIGARTTECQLHRELTSGLSMPIGFKNGTGGSLQLATDAVVCARHPHCFLSVSTQGLAAIVRTTGNDCCHLILRGGQTGPNYDKNQVEKACESLRKACAPETIMIDCSHGNSLKKYENQPKVLADVGSQVSNGDKRIIGVMIESNLVEGSQKLIPGQPLKYGQSVTDSCIGWDATVDVIKKLARDVRVRRTGST